MSELTPPPYPPTPSYGDPAAVASPFDADGYLEVDTPCRQCGYNLRGLTETHNCPECGLAVAMSAHGPLLRYARPDYVKTLAKGCKRVRLGIGLMLLSGFLVFLPMPLGALAIVGILGGLLLNWFGAWQLTTPDPSGLGEIDYGKARTTVRVTLLVGLCTFVIGFAEDLIPPNPAIDTAFAIVNLIGTVANFVGTLATLYYLNKLALRIPDEQLAARATFLRWGIVVIVCLLIFGGFTMAIAAAGAMTGGNMGVISWLAGIAMFVGGLGALVYLIMYLLLLYRLAKRFDDQYDLATQLYNDATAHSEPDEMAVGDHDA